MDVGTTLKEIFFLFEAERSRILGDYLGILNKADDNNVESRHF